MYLVRLRFSAEWCCIHNFFFFHGCISSKQLCMVHGSETFLVLVVICQLPNRNKSYAINNNDRKLWISRKLFPYAEAKTDRQIPHKGLLVQTRTLNDAVAQREFCEFDGPISTQWSSTCFINNILHDKKQLGPTHWTCRQRLAVKLCTFWNHGMSINLRYCRFPTRMFTTR